MAAPDKRQRGQAYSEKMIRLRRGHESRFPRKQSVHLLPRKPHRYNCQLGIKMERVFNRKLSYLPVDEGLTNILQRKVGHLEDELREQNDRYNTIRRQNASLEGELEILKNRVEFLYEWRRREGVKERTLGKETYTRVTPSDLEWIRNTLGPKISKEDVVRAVRSARDAR